MQLKIQFKYEVVNFFLIFFCKIHGIRVLNQDKLLLKTLYLTHSYTYKFENLVTYDQLNSFLIFKFGPTTKPLSNFYAILRGFLHS